MNFIERITGSTNVFPSRIILSENEYEELLKKGFDKMTVHNTEYIVERLAQTNDRQRFAVRKIIVCSLPPEWFK